MVTVHPGSVEAAVYGIAILTESSLSFALVTNALEIVDGYDRFGSTDSAMVRRVSLASYLKELRYHLEPVPISDFQAWFSIISSSAIPNACTRSGRGDLTFLKHKDL